MCERHLHVLLGILFGGLFLVAVLVAVAVRNPQAAVALASPYTELHAPQETPLDPFQHALYLPAVVIAVWQIRRHSQCKEWQALWVFLGAGAGLLLWRELPLDERLIGANTFSYAKYIGETTLPLLLRLTFAAGSMLVLATLGTFLLQRWRSNFRACCRILTATMVSYGGLLLGLSLTALLAAQALDKHTTTDAILGTHFSNARLNDYAEESFELLGAYFLSAGFLLIAVTSARTPATQSGQAKAQES